LEVLAMRKTLLIPSRRRRVPRQFSWIDQRLVRERHLGCCTAEALALYLFLVTVADAEGLSFYGDGAIAALLGWSEAQVRAARGGLVRADLIAFQAPLYQVLSLDGPPPTVPASSPCGPRPSARAAGELRSLRAILQQAQELRR
jgi:hypothetical protein